MNQSFYLDPAEVRTVCQAYQSQLSENADRLMQTEESLSGLAEEGSALGRSFSDAKAHLLEYQDLIDAMINLGTMDRADADTLSAGVGDEILDSRQLYPAYDSYYASYQDARDAADYYEWKSRQSLPGELKTWYENLSWSYQDSSWDYYQMALAIARKIQRYYDIEEATRHLFSESGRLYGEMSAALTLLLRVVRGELPFQQYQSRWREAYFRTVFLRIPLTLGQRQRLFDLGISEDQLVKVYTGTRSGLDRTWLLWLLSGDYEALRKVDPANLSRSAVLAGFSFLCLLAMQSQSGEIERFINGLLKTDSDCYRNALPRDRLSFGEDYFSLFGTLSRELQTEVILGALSGNPVGADMKNYYRILQQLGGLMNTVGDLAYSGNVLYDIKGYDAFDPSGGLSLSQIGAALLGWFLAGARIENLSLSAFVSDGGPAASTAGGASFSFDLIYALSGKGSDPEADCQWLDSPGERVRVTGGTYTRPEDMANLMEADQIEKYMEKQKRLTEKWAGKWLTFGLGEVDSSLADTLGTINAASEKELVENGSKLFKDLIKLGDKWIRAEGALIAALMPFANIFSFEARYQSERKELGRNLRNSSLEQQILNLGCMDYYTVQIGGSYGAEKQVLSGQGLYNLTVAANLGAIYSEEQTFFGWLEEKAALEDLDPAALRASVQAMLQESRISDPDTRRMLSYLLDDEQRFVKEALDPANANALWNTLRKVEEAFADLNGISGSTDTLDLWALLHE